MSWFSNAVHAVTKGATDAGHFVGKVADNPLTKTLVAAGLAATGVGAPAAAGILGTMAGGGALLKPGGNIGGAVKSGITGAALGGAAGAAGQAVRGAGGIKAALMAAGGLGGGGTPNGAGTIADASTGGMPTDGQPGVLDRLKGVAGSLGSSLGLTGQGSGTGGGTSLMDKLLMGGTVAAGALDEAHKRDLQGNATNYATGAYDAKAPLRARALALLQRDPVADPRIAAVSSDPGNVYDRARRARMLAASVPTTGAA